MPDYNKEYIEWINNYICHDVIDDTIEIIETPGNPTNAIITGSKYDDFDSIINNTKLKLNNFNKYSAVIVKVDKNNSCNDLLLIKSIFDSLLHYLFNFKIIEDELFNFYKYIMEPPYFIPVNKSRCEFLFPLQYAQAIKNATFNYSLTNFKHDLNKIQDKINKTIVLLFDSADLLSHENIEKLNGIFMNLSDFVIVMYDRNDKILNSFTPKIFSFIRQFKSIRIKEINKLNELILLLIKLSGIYQNDINFLTEHKLYKIKILGELVNRKLTDINTSSQSNDNCFSENLYFNQFDLVYDFYKNIPDSDLGVILFADMISKFTDEQLKFLYVLFSVKNLKISTFEMINELFEFNLDISGLNEHLSYFSKIGIIEIKKNVVHTDIDNSKFLLLKYFFNSKKLIKNDVLMVESIPDLVFSKISSENQVKYSHSDKINECFSDVDFLDIYKKLKTHLNCTKIIIKFQNINQAKYFYTFNIEEFERLKTNFSIIIKKLERFNCYIEINKNKIFKYKPDFIVNSRLISENHKILIYDDLIYKNYIENKDLTGALKYANKIFNLNFNDFNNFKEAEYLVNSGFILMITKKYDQSTLLFEKALKIYLDSGSYCFASLTLFNLGTIEFLKKDYSEAKEKYENAINYLNGQICKCSKLYSLFVKDNEIKLEVKDNFDLLVALKDALEAVNFMIKKEGENDAAD